MRAARLATGVAPLLLASLVALAAGCRDAEPRISRDGHILAGRPTPFISTTEQFIGRVRASNADLSGLENELHRLGLVFNVVGTTTIDLAETRRVFRWDPLAAPPAATWVLPGSPLRSFSTRTFRTEYAAYCNSLIWRSSFGPINGSCDPIDVGEISAYIDDIALIPRFDEATVRWEPPVGNYIESCSFAPTTPDCATICVRSRLPCRSTADCGTGDFCGATSGSSCSPCDAAGACPANYSCTPLLSRTGVPTGGNRCTWNRFCPGSGIATACNDAPATEPEVFEAAGRNALCGPVRGGLFGICNRVGTYACNVTETPDANRYPVLSVDIPVDIDPDPNDALGLFFEIYSPTGAEIDLRLQVNDCRGLPCANEGEGRRLYAGYRPEGDARLPVHSIEVTPRMRLESFDIQIIPTPLCEFLFRSLGPFTATLIQILTGLPFESLPPGAPTLACGEIASRLLTGATGGLRDTILGIGSALQTFTEPLDLDSDLVADPTNDMVPLTYTELEFGLRLLPAALCPGGDTGTLCSGFRPFGRVSRVLAAMLAPTGVPAVPVLPVANVEIGLADGVPTVVAPGTSRPPSIPLGRLGTPDFGLTDALQRAMTTTDPDRGDRSGILGLNLNTTAVRAACAATTCPSAATVCDFCNYCAACSATATPNATCTALCIAAPGPVLLRANRVNTIAETLPATTIAPLLDTISNLALEINSIVTLPFTRLARPHVVTRAAYCPGDPACLPGETDAVFVIEADSDRDGVIDDLDSCDLTADATLANADGDAFGDACDLCPTVSWPTNEREVCDCDVDEDGCINRSPRPGVCLPDPGEDFDERPREPGVDDTDDDGTLDDCDLDDDDDGVLDDGAGDGRFVYTPCATGETVDCDDNCVLIPNASTSDVQTDTNGDGVGNACDLLCGSFDPPPFCALVPGDGTFGRTVGAAGLRALPLCPELGPACGGAAFITPPCDSLGNCNFDIPPLVELYDGGLQSYARLDAAPVSVTSLAAFDRLSFVSIPDLDLDGRADLAIGEPGPPCTAASCAPGSVRLMSVGNGASLGSVAPDGPWSGLGAGIVRVDRRLFIGAPSTPGRFGGRTGAVVVVDLTDPTRVIDVWYGENDGDLFGASLVRLSDAEGRTVGILVGAPGADGASGADAGAVYSADLAGAIAVRYEGAVAGARVGSAASAILPQKQEFGGVFLGGPAANGGAGLVAFYGFDGTLRWTLVGEPGERLGEALSAAADFDGDGSEEVGAGAPGANGGAGRVVVLSAGGAIRDELVGSAGDAFGRFLETPGDVDGDGLSDLLAALPGRAIEGSAYAGAWVMLSGMGGTPNPPGDPVDPPF